MPDEGRQSGTSRRPGARVAVGGRLGFVALARRSNRDLYVRWTTGPGWSDEDLEDLFENRFPRIGADEFEKARADALCLDDEVTVTGIGGLSERWEYADGSGLAAVCDSSMHPAYTGHHPCHAL